MPYQRKLINGGVIQLQFFGASDADEHRRARDEAAGLCQEGNLIKVLVDMSEQTSFMSGATMDLFSFGESFGKGSFPRSAAIAVVTVSSPDVSKDVDFVVTVARNLGFMMQLFAMLMKR